MAYAIRFNNRFMQKQYEALIKSGYHWKVAEKRLFNIGEITNEY